jgi:hypothetical protein
MRRRESLFLVAGLVVGLIFGMVLVGTSDDLRESIFGTAASKGTDVQYYLVKLEDAQTWLANEYPDNSEQVKAAFDVLAKLPVGTVMPSADVVSYEDAQKDIEYVLPQTYAVLVGDKDAADKPSVKSDDPTSACLGVDDDPYMGATLYLYLTIPTEKAKKLDVPKEWEKLKDPKTNVLYWKLLACYPELKTK